MNLDNPFIGFIKNRWYKFKLYDRNLIIYWFLLSGLILTFRRNIDHWAFLFLLHLSFIFLLFMILPWLDKQKGSFFKFIRYWYIVIGLPFLYYDVGLYVHLIFTDIFDEVILFQEIWAFGTLPNVWLQQYVTPVLTEIMQVSYGVYWITIPLGGSIFYFKHEYDLYERLLHYVTITFFFSYFCFIFFPVAGPRFVLVDQITVSYKGLFLTQLLRGFVQDMGFRGGAFPSSHVAVAVVILIFIWHFKPKVAMSVFLPLVIALSLATVYGQYHYFTDVLAGFIVGLVIGLWGGSNTRKLIV
jgi:membrane-associated phospholipid phosphatase